MTQKFLGQTTVENSAKFSCKNFLMANCKFMKFTKIPLKKFKSQTCIFLKSYYK